MQSQPSFAEIKARKLYSSLSKNLIPGKRPCICSPIHCRSESWQDSGERANRPMKVVFTASGWHDYLWFQEHNRQLLKRINDLIKYAQRSPFRGLGKPEPLKGELSGYWSRRINTEHRLVYGVSETEL